MVHLNIEELLKQNNKSKYWLVTQLDSNYTVINKMINHETNSISFDMIEKLLNLFGCDIENLFIVEK